MMKTKASFLPLISVMFSVIQPAWSMEERDELKPTQNCKRPNHQIDPDQSKNEKEEKKQPTKRQKGEGEEQGLEEEEFEETSEEIITPEALYPYLEKRWKARGVFDTAAQMKFRDEVNAKNPPAIRLMLKALLDWERDLKRKSFLKKQLDLPTDCFTKDENTVKDLLKKYFAEIDSQNPYDIAFRYKHADASLILREDEKFLSDSIKESDDPRLIYKVAPVLLKVTSTQDTLRVAANKISELSRRMLDEKSTAGFSIRHEVKMSFRSYLAKEILGGQSNINFPYFEKCIKSLLQSDHLDNATPHQFYKSIQLALKCADSLYWKSLCDDLWIEFLPTIEQLLPESLRELWIPADLSLCLYYSENEGKGLDPLGLPKFTYNFSSWSRSLNRERADFYRRRAIEKKYDSDSISPELQAYLEHTYSTLIKNPSPPIKLLPNIMVDLAGESDNREINEHVGWLYLHGVGVKQDDNESQRRFKLASGSIL
ncbi:MAG: hypothetical protein BGO67_09395 [Alphaproteobacteria bacterium 41-28]|nr:MAG: hypothetical protein BGO67_09395 [Alphaproteobacteria bacterium 41-28]